MFKNKLIFKVISIIIIVTFITNEVSFARGMDLPNSDKLAAVSRNTPLVAIESDGANINIREDLAAREEFAGDFQEKFVQEYVDTFIEDAMELDLSYVGIRKFVKDQAKALPDIDFSDFYFDDIYSEGGIICLPFSDENGVVRVLRYFPDKDTPTAAIFQADADPDKKKPASLINLWKDPRVIEAAKDLKKERWKRFTLIDRAEVPSEIKRGIGYWASLEHRNGVRFIEKFLWPIPRSPFPKVERSTIEELIKLKTPGICPSFLADNDERSYFELDLDALGYNSLSRSGLLYKENLIRTIFPKIRAEIIETLRTSDGRFVQGHLNDDNILIKLGENDELLDVKIIDWKFLTKAEPLNNLNSEMIEEMGIEPLVTGFFSGTDLKGVDLSGAGNNNLWLSAADFRWSDLEGANMEGVDSEAAKFSGANLKNTILNDSYLFDADLTGADLRGSQLKRADLGYSNLTGADFSGADMEEADLTKTLLRGTVFDGAVMKGTMFDRDKGEIFEKMGYKVVYEDDHCLVTSIEELDPENEKKSEARDFMASDGSPCNIFDILRDEFKDESYVNAMSIRLKTKNRYKDRRYLSIEEVKRDLGVLVYLGLVKKRGKGSTAEYKAIRISSSDWKNLAGPILMDLGTRPSSKDKESTRNKLIKENIIIDVSNILQILASGKIRWERTTKEAKRYILVKLAEALNKEPGELNVTDFGEKVFACNSETNKSKKKSISGFLAWARDEFNCTTGSQAVITLKEMLGIQDAAEPEPTLNLSHVNWNQTKEILANYRKAGGLPGSMEGLLNERLENSDIDNLAADARAGNLASFWVLYSLAKGRIIPYFAKRYIEGKTIEIVREAKESVYNELFDILYRRIAAYRRTLSHFKSFLSIMIRSRVSFHFKRLKKEFSRRFSIVNLYRDDRLRSGEITMEQTSEIKEDKERIDLSDKTKEKLIGILEEILKDKNKERKIKFFIKRHFEARSWRDITKDEDVNVTYEIVRKEVGRVWNRIAKNQEARDIFENAGFNVDRLARIEGRRRRDYVHIRAKKKRGSIAILASAVFFIFGLFIITEIVTGSAVTPLILASMNKFFAVRGISGILPGIFLGSIILSFIDQPADNDEPGDIVSFQEIESDPEFQKRKEYLVELYKELSPESKKIFLYPEVLAVFLGVRFAYIYYSERGDPPVEPLAMDVMQDETFKKLGIWIAGPYIMYMKDVLQRLRKKGRFLVENNIITSRELALLISEEEKDEKESTELFVDLLKKYMDDVPGRDEFHGFILGYPLEDISNFKKMIEQYGGIPSEFIRKSKYGLEIVREKDQAKEMLDLWDDAIQCGYDIFSNEPDFEDVMDRDTLFTYRKLKRQSEYDGPGTPPINQSAGRTNEITERVKAVLKKADSIRTSIMAEEVDSVLSWGDLPVRMEIVKHILNDPVCGSDLKTTHKVLRELYGKSKADALMRPLIGLVPSSEDSFFGLSHYIVEDHDAILPLMDLMDIKDALCVNFDLHKDDQTDLKIVPEGRWARFAQENGFFTSKNYIHISSDEACNDPIARKKNIEKIKDFNGEVVVTICYDYFSSKKGFDVIDKEIQHIKKFLIDCDRPIRMVVSARSFDYVLIRLLDEEGDTSEEPPTHLYINHIDNRLRTMVKGVAVCTNIGMNMFLNTAADGFGPGTPRIDQMAHEDMELDETYRCNAPNVKNGPNIQIKYTVTPFVDEEGYVIYGNIYDERGKDEIGKFELRIERGSLMIDEYFPISEPEAWRENNNKYKNKGISQTFLYWLSNFAVTNGINEIYIDTPWLYNLHVFKKYFADEIKVTFYSGDLLNYEKSREWQSFEDINDAKTGEGFWSYDVMGEIEIRDIETVFPLAYLRLKHVEGTKNKYKIERNEWTEELELVKELREGTVITIDEKLVVKIGNKVIGVVAQSVEDVLIEIRGKPRIPRDAPEKFNADVKEIMLSGRTGPLKGGSPNFSIKVLYNKDKTDGFGPGTPHTDQPADKDKGSEDTHSSGERTRDELNDILEIIREEKPERASYAVDEMRRRLGELRSMGDDDLADHFTVFLDKVLDERPELLPEIDAKKEADRVLGEMRDHVRKKIHDERIKLIDVIDLLEERKLLKSDSRRRDKFKLSDRAWKALKLGEREAFFREKIRIIVLLDERIEERMKLAAEGKIDGLGRLSSLEAFLYLKKHGLPKAKRKAENCIAEADLNRFVDARRRIEKPAEFSYLVSKEEDEYKKISKAILDKLDEKAKSVFNYHLGIREIKQGEDDPEKVFRVKIVEDHYSYRGKFDYYVVEFKEIKGRISSRECPYGTNPDDMLGRKVNVVLVDCKWRGIIPEPRFSIRRRQMMANERKRDLLYELEAAERSGEEVKVFVNRESRRRSDGSLAGYELVYEGEVKGFMPLSLCGGKRFSEGEAVSVKVKEVSPKLTFYIDGERRSGDRYGRGFNYSRGRKMPESPRLSDKKKGIPSDDPPAIALVKKDGRWVQYVLNAQQHAVINKTWGVYWDVFERDHKISTEKGLGQDILSEMRSRGIEEEIHIHSPPEKYFYDVLYKFAETSNISFPEKGSFRLITHPGSWRDENGAARSCNLLIPRKVLEFLGMIRRNDLVSYARWLNHEVAHLGYRMKGEEKSEEEVAGEYSVERLIESYNSHNKGTKKRKKHEMVKKPRKKVVRKKPSIPAERKIGKDGSITLMGQPYYIGVRHGGKKVTVWPYDKSDWASGIRVYDGENELKSEPGPPGYGDGKVQDPHSVLPSDDNLYLHLKAIENRFTELMRQKVKKGYPVKECYISALALAEIISRKYGLPLGGDSPSRVEVVGGYYWGFDKPYTHNWVAILENNTPVTYIDGAYWMKGDHTGSIMVGPYLRSLKERRLTAATFAEEYPEVIEITEVCNSIFEEEGYSGHVITPNNEKLFFEYFPMSSENHGSLDFYGGDGDPVGYIRFNDTEIDCIFVDNLYRNRGYARAFLEVLLSGLKQGAIYNGSYYIEFGIFVQNPFLVSVVEDLGFELKGDEYIGPDFRRKNRGFKPFEAVVGEAYSAEKIPVYIEDTDNKERFHKFIKVFDDSTFVVSDVPIKGKAVKIFGDYVLDELDNIEGKIRSEVRFIPGKKQEAVATGTKLVKAQEADAAFYKDMASWEFLQALEINKAGIISERQGWSNTIIRTIRIPETSMMYGTPRGLDVLYRELAGEKTREFEFLHNEQGLLIGIFPVVKGAPAQDEIYYLDLTPYNFVFPDMTDPEAAQKWKDFITRRNADKKLLLSFAAERRRQGQLISNFNRQETDIYNYIGVDTLTGKIDIQTFTPETLSDQDFERIFKEEEGKKKIIIPVFPTVYTPAEMTVSDAKIIPAMWNDIGLDKGHRVLIAGSGSGIDSWIAYLKTGRKIYAVDINPLAAANTRLTAKIAGFDIETVTHDNIISENGEPVFDGVFDRIIWNMPNLIDSPGESVPAWHKKLASYWDGDIGGDALSRFARALPVMLHDDGIAMIWNDPCITRDEKLGDIDAVAEILRSAGKYRILSGITGDIMDVETSYKDSKHVYNSALYFIRHKPSAGKRTEGKFTRAQEMAMLFMDMLRFYADKVKNGDLGGGVKNDEQNIMIGLETSWIPKEQADIIQPLLSEIYRIAGSLGIKNIHIVRKEGDDFAGQLLKEADNKKVNFSNIIVLGHEDIVKEEAFKPLHDPKTGDRALLVRIDPEQINKRPENGNEENYIRIVDMINMALELAFNKVLPFEVLISELKKSYPEIGLEFDEDSPRVFTFMPKAEPIDRELLKKEFYRELGVRAAA